MRFEYLEAQTIEEAVSLLTKYDEKAKIIAGGTDLINQIRSKMLRPDYVIDIGYIPGLDYICCDAEQGLSIGALTTIRRLEKSADLQEGFPVISQAAGQLGSVAIRNMGTIGGNLCNAAPSAETAPALIGLGARVKIVGPEGERIVLLEEFFTGPGETALRTGEMIVEIQVPLVEPNTKGVYLKHAIRGSIDLAITGVAAIATTDGELCKDIRIVLGAVAPTPMRARKAEGLLKGQNIDDTLIEMAAQAASDECRPVSDVRATAEYRKQMVKVFTKYAINEAITMQVFR